MVQACRTPGTIIFIHHFLQTDSDCKTPLDLSIYLAIWSGLVWSGLVRFGPVWSIYGLMGPLMVYMPIYMYCRNMKYHTFDTHIHTCERSAEFCSDRTGNSYVIRHCHCFFGSSLIMTSRNHKISRYHCKASLWANLETMKSTLLHRVGL